MDPILIVGIILLSGTIASYFTNRMNLPKVVSFLIVGIILGPSILGIINKDFLTSSYIIIDIALAFIAFMIGGSLKIQRLKSLGKTIFNISLFQAQGTFLITSALLYLILPLLISNPTSLEDWRFYSVVSLLLGAISTATAPAAVLATIHEVKAKGRFTTTLLAIVAVDDSLALFNFILVSAISAFIISNGELELSSALYTGFTEIASSIVIGLICGLLLILIEKKLKSKSNKVIITFALMMLSYGISSSMNLDGILCSMTLGIVFANFGESFDFIYEEINIHFENIIFIFFFILSGAHLNFIVALTLPVVTILYVLIRATAKVIGGYIGGRLSNEDDAIKNYMGLALLPQAGVSIGLALSISSMAGFEDIGEIVLSIVIAATAINELAGPIITRYALKKVGETNESN